MLEIMARLSFVFSSLVAAALAVGVFAAPLLASADVGPAPKKKGCSVEEGGSSGREGAAAFGLCAATIAGVVVTRRLRRRG